MRKKRYHYGGPSGYPRGAHRRWIHLQGTLLVASIFVWGIVLGTATVNFGRIIKAELAVSILVLLLNLYGIFFRGYKGFMDDLTVTLAGHTLGSVVGFMILGVDFSATWQISSDQLIWFIQFLINVGMAFFLAIIPTLVICFVIWLIMRLWGEDA